MPTPGPSPKAPRSKTPHKTARTRRSALPDGRTAERAGGASGFGELIRAAGNTAIGRLLGRGPRIGRSDDPAEFHADQHADRAGPGKGSGKGSGKTPGEGPAKRPIGLDGAPRLGGGRALPGHLLRSFGPHFRADLRGVRLHTGREVDQAAHAMRAEAFTYGRDVFVRRDKYDPHTRSGRALLRHELAHVDADGGRGRVIRRKTGLPDAAEATQKGNGSGFLFMGKGEWGTYRGRLDKFRACADDKTERQAVLLRKLMDSSVKILASGYSNAKKDFVREQVPKIKRLYYEVAQKAEVFDTIESEAAARETESTTELDAGIRARMDRLRTQKRRDRHRGQTEEERKITPYMSPVQMPTAPTRDALLDRMRTAKITMNFPPSALGFFTADSDVKQFWALKNDKKAEGERMGKKYADGRDDAERMMGYKSMFKADGAVEELERSHRPISCGLNIFNRPKGAAAGYGKWHFELKDSIKARATYLSGDSIDQVYKKTHLIAQEPRAQHIGTVDHLSGVLASSGHVLDALFMEATGVPELASRTDHFGHQSGKLDQVYDTINKTQYVEVQVHGGISIDDIDWLVVDTPRDASSRTTDAQKSEGALVDAWLAKYAGKGGRVRWG